MPYVNFIADLPLQMTLTLNGSHTFFLLNPVQYGLIYKLQTSNYSRSGVLTRSLIFEQKQTVRNITFSCLDSYSTFYIGKFSVIIF